MEGTMDKTDLGVALIILVVLVTCLIYIALPPKKENKKPEPLPEDPDVVARKAFENELRARWRQ